MAATQPLQQFGELRAFEEQQALLGARGAAAQESAIGNIPVSQFDRELQRRQATTQRRQAAAAGELGSGASLLGQTQLAGAQQADIIQRRLQELEPLVSAARGVRSAISGTEEAAARRQAELASGLGSQMANIRLGSQAPLIESRLSQAQLSGLRGINAAQQRGQIANQLANVAGQLFQNIPQSNTNVNTAPAQQAGIPEAGQIGVA